MEQAGVLAGHVPHRQAHLLLLVHVKADQAWQILAWVTPALTGCVYCCGCTVRLCIPCYALSGPEELVLGPMYSLQGVVSGGQLVISLAKLSPR